MSTVNKIERGLGILSILCFCTMFVNAQKQYSCSSTISTITITSTVTCEDTQEGKCYPDGTEIYTSCSEKGNRGGDVLAAFILSNIFRRPVSEEESRLTQNRELLRKGRGTWTDPKGNVVTFGIPEEWLKFINLDAPEKKPEPIPTPSPKPEQQTATTPNDQSCKMCAKNSGKSRCISIAKRELKDGWQEKAEQLCGTNQKCLKSIKINCPNE